MKKAEARSQNAHFDKVAALRAEGAEAARMPEDKTIPILYLAFVGRSDTQDTRINRNLWLKILLKGGCSRHRARDAVPNQEA
jgi:hypothetical protein